MRRLLGLIEIYSFIVSHWCGIRPALRLQRVQLGAPLSIQEEQKKKNSVLAPNLVPRNLDLPRLKSASDWLPARSACHICIKQLFDDGRGPLKETAVTFVLSVLYCRRQRDLFFFANGNKTTFCDPICICMQFKRSNTHFCTCYSPITTAKSILFPIYLPVQ